MLRAFAFLLMLAGMAGAARADLVGNLTPDQVSQLKSGQMVVESKNVPGGVWPRVTVYTLIQAPVSTISAVLHDYAHAQDFQASILAAKVISQPSANVYIVEYTQKLPLFGTTTVTVQNTFSQANGGVTVQWKLLKSAMAEISDGSLTVEPYGGGSVMRYTNYVKPRFALAGVAKGAALDSVKTTVSELKTESEKRAKN